MNQTMTEHEFMADEKRQWSMQHDFGVMWTDGPSYPQYRVSYLQNTGELYAVRLARLRGQTHVEVLGVIPPGEGHDWSAPAEKILDGWAELDSGTWTLDWIRERMRRHLSQQNLARVAPGQLGTVAGGVRISADLPGLPGVPAEVSPVMCDDCRERTAVLRHECDGPDEPAEVTISCGNCGSIVAILPSHIETYLLGLHVGVLVEAARHGDPRITRDGS